MKLLKHIFTTLLSKLGAGWLVKKPITRKSSGSHSEEGTGKNRLCERLTYLSECQNTGLFLN